MEWAALVAWLATAAGGFVMLAIWLRRGGMQQREGRRLRPPFVLGHFGLAALGLVLWIVYVFAGGGVLPWIAFVLVVAAAAIGWTMFFIWAGQRQRRTEPAGTGGTPAEQHFPVAIVALHGVAAVTTVVLVLLASLGVGTG